MEQQSSSASQEWVESVVGRDWEIFWKPESTNTTTTTPQPQPAESAEDAIRNDKAEAETEETPGMFEELQQQHDSSERDPSGPSSQDMNVVMGESVSDDQVVEAEDMTMTILNDGSDEHDDDDDEHEADWYAGHILALVVSQQQQQQPDAADTDTDTDAISVHVLQHVFQVRFVGEDTLYEMPLTPANVRPCARAWVRRTRALLLPPAIPTGVTGDFDIQTQSSSLPPDTSTALDRQQLEAIRLAVQTTEYPPIPPDALGATAVHANTNGNSNNSTLPSQQELDGVRQLMVWIRSQVFLRSRLAPTTVVDDMGEHESTSMNIGAGGTGVESEEDIDPTEAYLDYLVKCLNELQEGCRWYYQCWQLHYRILYNGSNGSGSMDSARGNDSKVTPDFIKDCLEGGRRTVMMLISMDASVAGSKRKRRRQQQQISVSVSKGSSSQRQSSPLLTRRTSGNSPLLTRRTKRQRKNKGFTEFWHQADESSSKIFNEDVDEEDFRSTHIVKRLVERMRTSDPRWYSQYFGKMLFSLSFNFVAPLDKWKRRAEFYLGDKSTLDVEASDGETSGEESDDDESDSAAAVGERKSTDGSSSRHVTFEEIESSISSSQRDRVLQHFDLEDTVSRLQHKLESITDFAVRVWGVIGAVLDDSGESWDKEKDETTKGLDALLRTAVSRDSDVANVEPFGLGSSPLTRKVLKNAVVYRTWFLDLRYAEIVRERVAFVDDVVSRVSKLPPLPSKEGSSREAGTDISAKLDSVAERVRDLSAKHINHVALFNRYKALLNDRVVSNGLRQGLLTTEGVLDALGELRKTSVISVAEEMLTSRLDVLRWETDARETLAKPKPHFDEIVSLKAGLDAVLDGTSVTRSQLVHILVANTSVDTELRDFARSDIEALCDSLCQRTRTIYSAASMWKERADAILTVLRIFGNSEAGVALTAQKTPAMVDLRRVEDLLGEYDSLEVDLGGLVHCLTKVSETSRKWASTVTDYLFTDSTSFEGCLSLVEGTGQLRPRGVIIEPTRQAIETLHSLLQWYTSVKVLVCSPKMHDSDNDVRALLIEGLEVVTLFSIDRRSSGEFIVEPEQAQELLSDKQNSRKSARTLSRAKLESNPLCNAILARMVDSSRDAKEGYPLLSLLCFSWQIFAEDFARRSVASSSRGKFTLEHAKQLHSLRPTLGPVGEDDRGDSSNILWQTNPEVERFKQLIESGSRAEEEVRQLLSVSKGLLRESKYQQETVRLHLSRLKDVYTDFKSRVGSGGGIALDDGLEPPLDHNIKLFGWLVRTFQYHVLQDTDDSATAAGVVTQERIPWDILVGLYERIPSSDEEIGDFACVVLRVRELHEAATAWQAEISSLTMLSLRGGKRRSQTTTSPLKFLARNDDEDSSSASSKIDVEKVIQLSHHPILSKVAMPREEAVRRMLEKTKKFEVQLHEFLGKDYEGADLDRSPYPEVGSLVADDGTFLLYRLTGSPLFHSLKSRIASIAEIADDVFADTPGKATFDWICQAVSWIESLHSAVTRDDLQVGEFIDSRLVIPGAVARKLLLEGEAILLDVPEDLRKTLIQHRIFVSTNQGGNLTVKTTKGGAHHAAGVTVIRWCPFLFDSLKADVSRLDEWDNRIRKVSADFISFNEKVKGKPPGEASILSTYHGFQHVISNLLIESIDLVTSPTNDTIDASRALIRNLDSYIQEHSSSEIAREFAEMTYKDAPAALHDRFRLLDALTDRSSVASSMGIPMDTSLEDLISREGPFRNAGRVLIEKVLRKATEAMEIGSSRDATFSFCSLRAWEIENALYDLFQTDLGEAQISPEYRDKARTLKRSLEDVDNLTLCARVLTGEIDAPKLVRMTTEQLANPKTKQDRARAEAAARQNAVLTRSCSTEQNKPSLLSPQSKAAPEQSPVSSDLDMKPAGEAKKTSPIKDNKAHSSYASRITSTLGDVVKSVRSSRLATPPPPPPPSLAASYQSNAKASGSLSQDNLISNSSGGDRFQLSLANGSRKFMAGFSVEIDRQTKVDSLLPETLTEKGRLQIAEFSSFLSAKLSSGKWIAVVLRVVTFSDPDAKQLKKFIKDYELKNRIAMISLESESEEFSKLFVVTPKFHRAAKSLTVGNPAGTYAVLLKRSRS